MASPRKRKLRKYNSNRKSAIRARAAREGNPESTPVVEEVAPAVEEVVPDVKEVASTPKKTRKKKSIWSKKTSE
tara:strand:+ start:745 stop:966 length:222 start_codon:yes stop_codon:yes gene_type:complete